jgi:hypothetical protein
MLERGFTYMISTQGNQNWEEMFADAITEQDVVAKCDYDYIEIRPILGEDGTPLPGCCKIL